MAMTAPPPPLNVLGVGIHPITRDSLLDLLMIWASQLVKRRLYYTNAHVLNLAVEDQSLRRSLNGADLVIAEGYGAKLAAALLGYGIPEQLATMDWVDDWLDRLSHEGRTVFLVGDEPGIAEAAAREMIRRHPELDVVGTHHGFFDHHGADNDHVVAMIDAASPDILMVGLGTPLQERWIDANLSQVDARIFFALGAMFRWYSGAERRAPSWMRRLRLEWLLRLLSHPIRHFQRYVVGIPLFLVRILRQRFDELRS